MSTDLAAVVAEKLGAPAELVLRSAQARAQATGRSVEEVLAAWAGGEAVAASVGASTAETTPAAASATEEPAAPEPAAPAEPATAVSSAPAGAATATAVLAPPEPERTPVVEAAPAPPPEPVPLRERLRYPTAIGATVGAVFGVLTSIAALALIWDRVTATNLTEGIAVGFALPRTATIVWGAVVSAIFGALVAIVARTVPAWFRENFALLGTVGGAAGLGGFLGAVFGAVGVPVLFSLIGAAAGEGEVFVPVRGATLLLLLGGAALGGLTTAAVQVALVPAALPEPELHEAITVRDRLVTAFGVPVVAATVIALVVLPFALLLIEIHKASVLAPPIVGTVVAITVLALAFLMASVPGMRVTKGDVLVAAAGLGLLLFLAVLVVRAAFGEGGGHGDEAEHALLLISLF